MTHNSIIKKRVRQCRISQLRGGVRADDWKTRRIEEAKLDKNTRLVPQDVLVGDLVALDANDNDKHCFDPLSGRLNSREHVVHLDGVSERDDELIDESFLAISSRNRFERDVGRKKLADEALGVERPDTLRALTAHHGRHIDEMRIRRHGCQRLVKVAGQFRIHMRIEDRIEFRL